MATPKLYVVPALKKELREAYIRMRTLKYKKQMSRQNLYFRGFPVDSSVSNTITERADFLQCNDARVAATAALLPLLRLPPRLATLTQQSAHCGYH